MNEQREPKDEVPARLPYQRPKISWEEQMDNRPSLMAACAKIAGQDEPCNAAPGGS